MVKVIAGGVGPDDGQRLGGVYDVYNVEVDSTRESGGDASRGVAGT